MHPLEIPNPPSLWDCFEKLRLLRIVFLFLEKNNSWAETPMRKALNERKGKRKIEDDDDSDEGRKKKKV